MKELNIGDIIEVSAIVQKTSHEDFKRCRERKECEKIGFVVGLRKKLVEWEVKSETWEGFPGSTVFEYRTIPIKYDYVVEFKERITSKTQEALLADVKRINNVLYLPFIKEQ